MGTGFGAAPPKMKGDGYLAGGIQSTYCLPGSQFVGLFDEAITKELTR